MNSPSLRFWVVTLATVLTMLITGSLGLWQLDRAAQKQALEAQMSLRSQMPAWTPVDLLQATDLTAGWYRPVRLQGFWVSEATVFLDNRQMEGRVGFYVVTPLRLVDSDRVILVQRGWVARDFVDRTRLPPVETPHGLVTVTGYLAPAPAKLFDLGDMPSGVIRQNIDLPSFAMETGLSLMPVSVMQNDLVPDGLLRHWPRVASGVPKHHGYAFQWFGLCLLVGVLYVWFQWIAPRRKR
ncbi:MAG: hypothetical protein RLZZ352_2169 [Pseudomonadota bacterium]